MDLSESINILKGVPDQALQHELVQPSGMIPGYLVLAEAKRRQLLRQAEQKQQGQQSGSVYDDVIRNMMARQPPQGLPPAPPGMTPTPNAPPSGALGSTPPQNFQAPRGMAEGGEVDDGDDDTPVMSPTGSASRSMEDSDWEPIIQRAAKDNNLDPALIRAMVKRESGGNRKALSPKGALGPMQLMPGTAKDLGVTDRTDPAQAIPAGAHYLREHLDKYGDLDKALAAYNAGPGAVDQYGGVPPYKETRDYIKAIRGNLHSQQPTFLGPGRPDLLPSGPIGMLDDQGNEVPLTPAKQQAAAPATQPEPLPSGPTLPLPTPDSSGLAAVLSSAGPGPAPPSPTATAPAAIPSFHQPTMDEMMAQARKLYGPPPQDPVLRAELGRLEAQAQRLRKPDIWGTLAALGSGMASSTSPFWGQALGAGAAAVLKNENVRQEQARQLELATMGISEKLDDRAQQYQRGLAEVGMKAQGQYEQHQLASYNAAAKVPGAVIGKETDPPPGQGWEFVAHPYADLGAWVPPGSVQQTTRAAKTQFERDFLPGYAADLGKKVEDLTDSEKRDAFTAYQTNKPVGTFERNFLPGYAASLGKTPATITPQERQTALTQFQQKPTGVFEKDFLPGWAEDHNTTPDKLTGIQKQQALADFKVSQVDPNIKSAATEIAQGIMDGTQPPDMKGLYRYGAQVRAILHENHYDYLSATRDWQNLQKYYSTLNGATQMRMRQATEFVSQTLPTVRQLYQDWRATGLPTGFKDYNKVALIAATKLPGEAGVKAQLLLTQLNDLTSEVGTMYKGGNSSTDETLRLAGENLKGEWNPDTFNAALGQLENNVRIRKNSMNSIAPAGVTPGSPYLAPGGPGAPNRPATPVAGVTPSGMPPKRYQLNGREIVPKADGWYFVDSGQKVP